ncbi:hypothetical protein BJX66DRAFT_301694 [Aspergillus keveii]|uniref:BZIP domain-containing protein n=1 Tax=Aspergillus keveii TaxID=714993 RepID=A0ABR4G9Y5_9EURO
MEDFYWSSQVSSPSSHISGAEYDEIPWRLVYDQGHPSIHHRSHVTQTSLNNSGFSLPEDHYTATHHSKSYHGPDLSLVDHLALTMFNPASTLLLGPAPGSDLVPQKSGWSVMSHQSTPSAEARTTRRRAQNREAQRRFRQKKEDAQKVLEERISSLDAKCKEVAEQLAQKCEAALELERERKELEEQVQELRRNGQMLGRVVRQPALFESFISILTPALTQH